jgi:hypothetical protein
MRKGARSKAHKSKAKLALRSADTPRWPECTSTESSTNMTHRITDRITGCLKGIAIGDAIGKQTEMLSRENVLRW